MLSTIKVCHIYLRGLLKGNPRHRFGKYLEQVETLAKGAFFFFWKTTGMSELIYLMYTKLNICRPVILQSSLEKAIKAAIHRNT